MEKNMFDLIVLGGGPGGYTAAERAGQAGMRVLCIEERALGGVCLNEGCIPTKTLLYSTKLYDGAAHGARYGVTAADLSIDHGKVMARKDKVVKTLAAGVAAKLRDSGVTVVKARGVVAGASASGYAVRAGEETYTGRRLLIATGSSPIIPPIPGIREGLNNGFVLTNREILSAKEPPQSLAVIGGGVIGLELASYFNSIGASVTVLEMLDHIAGENDPDLVKRLQKSYERKGVTFLLAARVTDILDGAVRYEQNGMRGAVEAERALLSIGRRPNTRGMGLEAIGVTLARGAVVTDSHMRTNLPEVYAVGDVNGTSMLAHTAYREAEAAVNAMLGIADEMCYDAIPSVVYTNPELSAVGETEYTARQKGMDVTAITVPMRYSGRYLAENEGGDGVMKLVVDRASRCIIGVQALCNYSSEFIAMAGDLVRRRATPEEIRQIVFPHPTVSEILREAATML